ncbi:MAG: biotin synthase auxiliary protein BsaP [Solirubrobacteraceae bacterium]
MQRHCDACGGLISAAGHELCRARRSATDPPRFCVTCGRKLVVQVLPFGWNARCVRCGPVPSA